MSRSILHALHHAHDAAVGNLITAAAWWLNRSVNTPPTIGKCLDVDRLVAAGAPMEAALRLLPLGAWYLIGAGRTVPREPLYGAQVLRHEAHAPYATTVVGEGQHATSLAAALTIANLHAWVALHGSVNPAQPKAFES